MRTLEVNFAQPTGDACLGTPEFLSTGRQGVFYLYSVSPISTDTKTPKVRWAGKKLYLFELPVHRLKPLRLIKNFVRLQHLIVAFKCTHGPWIQGKGRILDDRICYLQKQNTNEMFKPCSLEGESKLYEACSTPQCPKEPKIRSYWNFQTNGNGQKRGFLFNFN